MKNSTILFILLLLLVVLNSSCHSQNSQKSEQPPIEKQTPTSLSMTVTIDDLPLVSLIQTPENYQEVTKKLLHTLQEYKVPAIGFVNEGKLYDNGQLDSSRLQLLQDWLDAGQELGNHTFGHPDYHHISFEQFSANILKGEKLTRPLVEQNNSSFRYFRHPFLHTGNSLEKKQLLDSFLLQHNYTVAPVTIDNSEWIFARAYDNALLKEDSTLLKKIGEAYVTYMNEKTVFFENNAQELFERAIPQTLLIHANTLNADWLDKLLEVYQKRGYQFVSLETALKDPAYQSADEYTGRGGITWLHRWALTKKVDKSFYKGEPMCPEFIQEVAGIKE